MAHYPIIKSAEPTTAQYVAETLYFKYAGPKTRTYGTAYQADGVCLCFDGDEETYLPVWGVRAVGVKSRKGAENPATSFEVRDVTLHFSKEKKMLKKAIKEVRLALSGK